jgi:hypothetical protein
MGVVVQNSFGYLLNRSLTPWSGNEEDDEQWFKTVPFVSLEMAIGP